MGAIVILLFLLCWVFSFSKSWEAYHKNKTLNGRLQDNYALGERSFQISRKYRLLDSLVKTYSMDSAAFHNSFLQDVSLAIEGIPVQLSYDAGKKKDAETFAQTLYGDISLEGSYKDLVRAVDRLEQVFFVNRILYKDGVCVVRLGKCNIK